MGDAADRDAIRKADHAIGVAFKSADRGFRMARETAGLVTAMVEASTQARSAGDAAKSAARQARKSPAHMASYADEHVMRCAHRALLAAADADFAYAALQEAIQKGVE